MTRLTGDEPVLGGKNPLLTGMEPELGGERRRVRVMVTFAVLSRTPGILARYALDAINGIRESEESQAIFLSLTSQSDGRTMAGRWPQTTNAFPEYEDENSPDQ